MRLALLAVSLLLLVPGSARAAPLTNTAHLDFLGTTVSPPEQAGHSTYGADPIGVLWTYADRQADGSYRRVGGGAYDAASNTYGQGAFNADDIARAAVVYVRHWRQTGSAASRERAVALLRGLTYLQSPNGNVVLWMQPDGTLNVSADPPETPDPSDSGASYWLARTIWALGEGYAAFRRDDPAFAAFLRDRLELALGALDREVLGHGWQVADGRRVPGWLIVDGADATAEAMLGLAAYVEAGGSDAARSALARFADGVAALGGGDPRTWPYGALLPSATTRSVWHAWASQMPEALAHAAAALGRRDLLAPALADAASFTPHLLVAAGPENGWNPAPTDHTQIAYGADSRLQSLLAVGNPGPRRLAGIAAAWYFGNNPAGAPMYDPATGVTYDGVSGDGAINRNSGAESTVHGLLSMLALDAAPDVAAQARIARPVARRTQRILEAEDATLAGGASVVTPPAAWTGESAWSGGRYVTLPPGGSVAFGTDAPGLIQPVALRTADGSGGATRWGPLGTLQHANAGAQGASAIPGVLEAQTLPKPGASPVATQAARGTTALDAVLFQPLIESLSLAGDGRGQTLLRSFALGRRTVAVHGTATSYDTEGRVYARSRGGAVVIPPGGFALAEH
ncbi:hypothetical protein [Candidatus Solirubrobacter pratensis]|uniref:hypothetical protein n=1 Tax=Candidatus Solirubrobacter pratensis TaxID=1298857 RepID=UPI0004287270|nr:hypothetical protein [Candidatus Solirubrobacter pratensis]